MSNYTLKIIDLNKLFLRQEKKVRSLENSNYLINNFPNASYSKWLGNSSYVFLLNMLIAFISYKSAKAASYEFNYGDFSSLFIAIVLYFFIRKVISFAIKSWIPKRLKEERLKISNTINSLNSIFEEKIVPDLISFGMFSLQDTHKQNLAKNMDLSVIESLLDNHPDFEKIELENTILYKGLTPEAFDNIETVIIEL